MCSSNIYIERMPDVLSNCRRIDTSSRDADRREETKTKILEMHPSDIDGFGTEELANYLKDFVEHDPVTKRSGQLLLAQLQCALKAGTSRKQNASQIL